MNKEARIQVLRQVRALIESGEYRLICFAIDRVIGRLLPMRGEASDHMYDEALELRRHIQREIAGHATLNDWVLAEMGYANVWASHLRLAWIDRMLEDLK